MTEHPVSETAKREEEILNFWRTEGIFEKSLARRAPHGEYVFYDGPPFATGLPHHGSLLSSIIKDVIPRYKTMRGYRVRRRWGWDCHGLPIESLVEKELGLKTKKEIETIGVKAFNEKARSMVLQFVHDWERYVERVGRWVDFRNSYKTMDNTYIESVWWALKQLWDKELLYEGRKVLMYCPHCETPLAKAEIAMDNTYKDITEEAVTVKFKVKNPSKHGLPENTFILAWTTTPWTLPGNVALAVNADIEYKVGLRQGDTVISANLSEVEPRTFKGSALVGIEYEPLFDVPALQSPTSYKVYAADFVTTGEGTGIVHTAVMYGEDDYVLGEKEKLPMVQLLNANGTYNDKVPEFIRGKYIKDAERDIKRDLESRGLLFDRKNNTHSYPHCYRCGTPLIYNAVPSWFLGINKAPKGHRKTIKARMLEENEKVNWVPEHLKHGRFGNILENAPDWTISRNRFWASPLPIWREKGGEKVMVLGSIDEIKKRVKKNGNHYFVMRHGLAEQNAQGIVESKNPDAYKLTEKGREQIRSAAEKLKGKKITTIFASPYLRTRESAEIAADTLGIPRSQIVVDARIGEMNMGEINASSIASFVAWRDTTKSLNESIPGGESYLDAKRRFGQWLREKDVAMSNENVLVVTHGIGVESLTAVFNGLSNSDTKEMVKTSEFKNGGVYEFESVPLPLNDDFEIDLHRPYIDSIILTDNEGREYERTPEVVDCWVESGSMPFAEYHYPYENKGEFEKRAPGDFIAEYIAQTRTWFYYTHAMGVMLFDRLAFKNVVSTGTILAGDGEKLSKSKRNYTDPLELINRYGADSMRFLLMASPVMQAEDVRFRDEDVRDAHNRVVQMLWNCYKFFELYKNEYDGKTSASASTHPLDIWIRARFEEVQRETTTAFDAYDMPTGCRAIKAFIDDYSTWYVRRSRERIKAESGEDKQFALATQREILLGLARLLAPITPFIAESVYRGADGEKESVHLDTWPTHEKPGFFAKLFGKKAPETRILHAMQVVRASVSKALEARDKAGMRVRQPLAKLEVAAVDFETLPMQEMLLEIIADEVNVKSVVISIGVNAGEIALDVELTDALREEGMLRDAIREIQAYRKEQGLKPGDTAEYRMKPDSTLRVVVEKHRVDVEKETNTTIVLE